MIIIHLNYMFFLVVISVALRFCQNDNIVQALSLDRRSCLEYFSSLALSSAVQSTTVNDKDRSLMIFSEGSRTSSSIGLPSMPENIEITDKVFMDVRVARSDGSTYIRDDLPNTFENRVLYQRITIGLYGTVAPNHVNKFLGYIEPTGDGDIDNPYPSYSRSSFPQLDQDTGLLKGGYISGVRAKDVAGTTALTYGGRIIGGANLWIENGKNANTTTTTKLSHTTKGLLTHKNLEVLPNFGITTRSTPTLDGSQTVFGQVMWDEETLNFFRDLEEIPTYSVGRPADYDDFDTTGAVAKTVFNAQREFFRGAAKSMGDDRVGKLYDGKLLRRMEVLQVGRIL